VAGKWASRDPDSLLAAIAPLAGQVAAIQDQLRALGRFANDRELLECQRCGIKEDVTYDGRLITCREPTPGQDTGLRFEALAGQTFRCPACHQLVYETAQRGRAERRTPSMTEPPSAKAPMGRKKPA